MAKSDKKDDKNIKKEPPKKDKKDNIKSTDLSFEDLVKMSMQQPPKKKKS